MSLKIAKPIPRIMGDVEGARGPLLIACAGIHGNEPAGVIALQKIVQMLEQDKSKLRGRFIALSGNRQALELGKRFIDRDLNRMWDYQHVQEVESQDLEHLANEQRELREILNVLESINLEDYSDFLFVDVHTTSAEGGVFAFSNDLQGSFDHAMALGIPVISNLTERLSGTTINFFEERGLKSIGFEAGQNEEIESIDRAIGGIGKLLINIGGFDSGDIPDLDNFIDLVDEYGKDLPRVIRLCYRHEINEGDGFQMKSGFGNFQAVKQDDVLAVDKNGQIKALEDGLLLMPLYQSQGVDGFFIVQEES